mgnify:CR=1 FL=1
MMKKDTIKWFIILHMIILVYSISGICSKTAAGYDFLSPKWILFYGLVICILGFYAIAWQQVLKHLPLIATYANKAVTTLWGLVWGFVVFHEKITVLKVVGAAVVIAGVYLVVTGDEEITSGNDAKEDNDNA